MSHHEHITLILIITLLASTPLATVISPNASTQQEMTPTQTFETHEEYFKLAFSADGNHIAAISNETDTLTLFNRIDTLWNTHVPGISSIAISENASLIVAGANSGVYIFTTQNPTPQRRYDLNYPNPLIALSNDASTLAYAATTMLYVIQTGNQNPTWNTTLQGTLESLSIAGNGNYISATTNHPGTLYLFSRQQPTPTWTYNLGENSGATRLSHSGEYLIATGGNQTSQNPTRIYRFRTQSALPNYIKIISELASTQETALSSDGSIFAINQAVSKRLIFFNLNLPPYGYGPGSVLNISLPSKPTSISMSLDGKYTVVGTDNGIYLYQYQNRQLTLTKQYTANTPSITDIAISGNGSHLAALGNTPQNSKNSAVYLFNLQETRDTPPNLLPQLTLLTISIIIGSTAIIYTLRKKQKPQKPSSTT